MRPLLAILVFLASSPTLAQPEFSFGLRATSAELFGPLLEVRVQRYSAELFAESASNAERLQLEFRHPAGESMDLIGGTLFDRRAGTDSDALFAGIRFHRDLRSIISFASVRGFWESTQGSDGYLLEAGALIRLPAKLSIVLSGEMERRDSREDANRGVIRLRYSLIR